MLFFFKIASFNKGVGGVKVLGLRFKPRQPGMKTALLKYEISELFAGDGRLIKRRLCGYYL